MPDLFGRKQHRGASGRIPDSRADDHQTFINAHFTLPPELHARLGKYCDDEERAKSWVAQKALDAWLTKKGY